MRIEDITHGKITNEQFSESFTNKKLQLILLPTEKCNFRCTYCYEDFELGKMSDKTISGIKNLIKSRVDELKILSLSWFGGEPLLAQGIILDISRYAYNLCKSRDVLFEGGFTTNGYLLNLELFRKLIELNQNSFQISLDGWMEMHDETRVRADGEGTFDIIWNNLKSFKELDGRYEVTLRVHLNDRNFESLRHLCKEIRKEFGNDERFKVHFHDVRDLGGEGGKTVKNVNPEDYNLQVKELHKILHSDKTKIATTLAPAGGSESNMIELETESTASDAKKDAIQYICYASKPNSLLIRSNGRVGKCTVALDDDRNDIGKINEDGTLEIFQERFANWVRGFNSMDQKTLGCPWHNMGSERFNNSDVILREKL